MSARMQKVFGPDYKRILKIKGKTLKTIEAIQAEIKAPGGELREKWCTASRGMFVAFDEMRELIEGAGRPKPAPASEAGSSPAA